LAEKHTIKHENLIIDFCEGLKLDDTSIEKVVYLLQNCKECELFADEYSLLVKAKLKVQSDPELKNKLLHRMKEKYPEQYKSYLNTLAQTDEGIEFIWDRENINDRLADYALAASGTISIDANAKRTILKRLGIIKK